MPEISSTKPLKKINNIKRIFVTDELLSINPLTIFIFEIFNGLLPFFNCIIIENIIAAVSGMK
jgi:hypothetical protein